MENNTCAICFEDIDDFNCKRISCNHLFHKECLDRWILYKRVCPMCREPVKKPTKKFSWWRNFWANF